MAYSSMYATTQCHSQMFTLWTHTKASIFKLYIFYCCRTLLAHMNIFTKMKNPRSIYREPDLNRAYLDFLTHKNPEVQKMALDCLVSYKPKYLIPYRWGSSVCFCHVFLIELFVHVSIKTLVSKLFHHIDYLDVMVLTAEHHKIFIFMDNMVSCIMGVVRCRLLCKRLWVKCKILNFIFQNIGRSLSLLDFSDSIIQLTEVLQAWDHCGRA